MDRLAGCMQAVRRVYIDSCGAIANPGTEGFYCLTRNSPARGDNSGFCDVYCFIYTKCS
jgi:hypothetical protein